jgi:hypothetical protein
MPALASTPTVLAHLALLPPRVVVAPGHSRPRRAGLAVAGVSQVTVSAVRGEAFPDSRRAGSDLRPHQRGRVTGALGTAMEYPTGAVPVGQFVDLGADPVPGLLDL